LEKFLALFSSNINKDKDKGGEMIEKVRTFPVSTIRTFEGEDPLDDIFLVKINKNEHVDGLKHAVKARKQQKFAEVDPKELRLWKVDITLDKPNEKLEVLENQECAVIKERLKGMKLVPFKKIIEYFSEVPKENHLSIIIERPPVIKSISSLEVYQASLNDIKHKILDTLPLPQDTTADILALRFSRENDKSSEELEFKNDKNFQEYLKYCIMTSSLSLKVQVYTLQKAFSEWKLGTVCDLFELPSNFHGIDSFEDSKAEELLKHFYKDLKLRKKAIHEHDVQGKYGRGPLDFCLYLKGIIIGVVEVKKEDFDQGVAQTAMQLHCSLE
ncbi:16943_t:CDS:2, partial [Racocetra fulgida]